ncbi:NUDIX domain-containing protein [Patescibacteria group bacterium]|nr:NUDIX domain-containing protein [Patescibacteria group bacterium]MCL5010082.1 NUDIX domain-containing protein [Patescibacteria group bacterium]
MSHVHELIDFAVSAFIVKDNKVLLIHHKKLNKWLPIGGHIELNEDPEEALLREIKEESGLNVDIEGERPNIISPGTKFLHRPRFVDVSEISQTHRHIHFIYFLKSEKEEVRLSVKEHNDIRWFSLRDLDNADFNLLPSIRYYSQRAIEEIGLIS